MAVKLELMGYLEAETGWKGNRHAHSFWELVFLESGKGELFYAKARHAICAGDVFLLEPQVAHRFVPESAGVSRHLYVGFSFEGGFPPWSGRITPPLLDKERTLAISEELSEIVTRMKARRTQADLEECSSDVVSVLLKLLSGLVFGVGSSDEKPCRSAILVGKVKSLLAENLKANISVHRLAGNFYLSPHYFGDVFKRNTGMTVKEYHNFLRLKKAEEQLRDPERRISEIAEALGYESIHYFSRKFRQYHGVSPSEFRAGLSHRGAAS